MQHTGVCLKGQNKNEFMMNEEVETEKRGRKECKETTALLNMEIISL